MGKADLLLMCGHPSPYMCSRCAKCSQCCYCRADPEKNIPLPPLTSTLKLESQDRLRELRRSNAESATLTKPA